jgi:transposase InsO family protein
MTQAQAAEMQGVSRATVSKWWRRYRQEGVAGLDDRSSRPATSPRALPAGTVAEVVRLRYELGAGPHMIAARLKMQPSTVYRVLKCAGLSRLAWLDRSTRVVIRYEKKRPGRLVHLDVKKLRRIPDGGGRRKDPQWYQTNTSYRIRGPLRGQDFVHVAVDDCSRYAYVEVLADEKAATTEGFLRRAVAAFKARGVMVKHIITDNGANYRSKLFRSAAQQLRICLHRTRPYRPQTNGKAEAFIKTLKREWAYARIYGSNDERVEALKTFLDYYNHQRPHTSLGLKPPVSRCKQPLG